MGITATFSTPWYSGIAISPGVPRRFQVGIGGHAYVIDPRKTKHRTLPIRREQQDTGSSPGQNSLSTLGSWPHSQADWSLGAGQVYRDEEDSLHRRFRSSKGVNPWVRNELTLLKVTASKRSSVNTNLKLLSVNGYLYLSDGNDLLYTADPTASSPTWNDTAIEAGEAAGSVPDYTSSGSVIYACHADGVHSINVGTTVGAAHFATIASPTKIQYANGRLLVAAGVRVAEIDSGGTVGGAGQLDFSHPATSFVWSSIAAAPNGIYLAGNVNDRAYVYFTGIDPATGGLAEPVVVNGGWPDGETISCLYYYGGLMCMGTSRGLRVALIGDDNSLAWGPVIEAPGHVRCIEGQGEFIWFGWTNYDGTDTGLGRANLAEVTTSPLTPAYASDLMATTQGNVLSAETHSSRRYFTVSGVGAFGEGTNRVASGELFGGRVRYGTYETKSATGIDVRHDALDGTVVARVANEDGTVVVAGTSSVANSSGPAHNFDVGDSRGEWFEPRITLTRDSSDNTLGPTLRRYTLRALPTPKRQDAYELAIILRTKVELPPEAGHRYYYNVMEEYQYLKDLESAGRPVLLQIGNMAFTAMIEGIEEQPDRWSDKFEFMEGILLVTLVTLETGT